MGRRREAPNSWGRGCLKVSRISPQSLAPHCVEKNPHGMRCGRGCGRECGHTHVHTHGRARRCKRTRVCARAYARAGARARCRVLSWSKGGYTRAGRTMRAISKSHASYKQVTRKLHASCTQVARKLHASYKQVTRRRRARGTDYFREVAKMIW